MNHRLIVQKTDLSVVLVVQEICQYEYLRVLRKMQIYHRKLLISNNINIFY